MRRLLLSVEVGGDVESKLFDLDLRCKNDFDEDKPRPSRSTDSQQLGVLWGRPLSNIMSSPLSNSVHPSSFVRGFVAMTATRSFCFVTSAKSIA